ncbi:MAG: hypothetical protein WBF93_11390 [Pirellulales bacterium]
MPTVSFTGNIQRHVVCPAENVRATSVRDALEAVFADNQQARNYFLDEQGALRHHIVAFVNGTVVRDRVHPQQHAYDLVYRHALDVVDEGRMLAMGSTTGSLWVSEDQGDHRTTISTQLPPIDCVCFGE